MLVSEAARMFDRLEPGWADRIDTQTLNLYSNDHCVLGQLYGSYCRGLGMLQRTGQVTWESKDSPFIQGEHENKLYEWLVEVMNRRFGYVSTARELELVA